MNRIGSIEELYAELIKIDNLNNKSSLEDGKIIISFHKGFILKIVLKNYFDVYFNDTFYYSIEDQDILESLLDIIKSNYIFVERKNIVKKNKVLLLTNEEFEKDKEKWINKTTLCIYSTEKLIFDNKNN